MPDWQSVTFGWLVLAILFASTGILSYVAVRLYVESRILRAVQQRIHSLNMDKPENC